MNVDFASLKFVAIEDAGSFGVAWICRLPSVNGFYFASVELVCQDGSGKTERDAAVVLGCDEDCNFRVELFDVENDQRLYWVFNCESDARWFAASLSRSGTYSWDAAEKLFKA